MEIQPVQIMYAVDSLNVIHELPQSFPNFDIS